MFWTFYTWPFVENLFYKDSYNKNVLWEWNFFLNAKVISVGIHVSVPMILAPKPLRLQ